MYVLISKAKLRSMGDNRFHETIPDGRMMVPISDLRSYGSITGVDIITTSRQLKELIAEQQASGLYPEAVVPEEVPSTGDMSVIQPSPLPSQPSDGGSQEGLADPPLPPVDAPAEPAVTPHSSVTQSPTVDTASQAEKGAKA